MRSKQPKSESQELSLDELLERQRRAATLATITAVPEKKDMVKLTPWLPGGECLCHFAIVVPKRSIERLTSTRHQHLCCGKLLDVVQVTFRDTGAVSVSEIFSQLLQHGGQPHEYVGPARLSTRMRTFGGEGVPEIGVRPGDSRAFCTERCNGDPDPEQCMCFCQNLFRRIKRFC